MNFKLLFCRMSVLLSMNFRLRDELLDSILTESVNESLHVARLAKTHDRQQLERILATVPVSALLSTKF